MSYYPPPYAPRPPKKSRLPWILGIGLAVVFGGVILVLTLAVGLANNAKPRSAAPATTSSTAAPRSSAPPAAAAPSSTKPTGPLREFSDGIYKVGVDIEAGSYKTEGSKYCYWQRMKDDSGEFESIIANHIGDGPQRVTVKAGEFFEVNRCKWTKG